MKAITHGNGWCLGIVIFMMVWLIFLLPYSYLTLLKNVSILRFV